MVTSAGLIGKKIEAAKPEKPHEFTEGDNVNGKVILLFAAVTNTDTAEGKGSRYNRSYHPSEHEALIGSSKIGLMGSDGNVEERLVLCLEGSRFSGNKYFLLGREVKITHEGVAESEAELRRTALEKLTPGERTALGVDGTE